MVASVSCPDSNLTEEKLRPALLLIAVCFTFSGAAGLIYEVLWMRMLGLVFGATTIAVSVVLAAFMGGLALGSAFAARVVPRMTRPLRAYGWIEIVIGLYAVAVPAAFRVIDHLDAILWQRIHPSAFGFAIARFLFAGIVLLVPTVWCDSPANNQPAVWIKFDWCDRGHARRRISAPARVRNPCHDLDCCGH
jgi:hypothetical protein